MAGKYKITIEQIDEDYGTNEISFSKECDFDPTWTDLLGVFANCLSGLGYVLSEDIRFVFENLDLQNAESAANAIDSYDKVKKEEV